MAVWDILFIFAVMREEDRDLIKRLLNRDKTSGDEFLDLCSYAIDDFIAHYHDNCKDKKSLKLELSNELYDYIIRKDLLRKFNGKNSKGRDCCLKTYLNSIAKYRLSRVGIVDPLITKTKEKRKDKEEKDEEIIKKFDDEPLNFFVSKSTPIPTEFRDEDEAFDAEYLYVGIDEQETDNCDIYDDGFAKDGDNNDDEEYDDVIVDIDNFKDIFIDNTTNRIIELVRQTLDQLPPKESLLLKKRYYEDYSSKELAKELGHTENVINNMVSTARKDFRTIYLKLKNGLL
jgi:RNA polymerase sigma factor (sigma-70 family)